MQKKYHKKVFLTITFGFLIVLVTGWWFLVGRANKDLGRAVKIGYFHGGRTMLLYRAYIDGEFDRGKTRVELYTRDLNGSGFYKVPNKPTGGVNDTNFGKVRGGELIDEVVSGALDGATVGESSFIKAVGEGKPIVAVALLGHDTKDAPAHAILVRSGITIEKLQDLKGKTLVTRRAGDGDATFLREFLLQSGLDPDKDVKIVEQTDDNTWMSGLKDGTFDGGYYHEMAVKVLVTSGDAYIWRRLDWVDPEMSQALLVFNKDFVKQYPDKVSEILRVYLGRIKYEKGLSREVRMQYSQGMQMEDDFQGMNLPQYNFPPLVSTQLLDQMQDLLIKQGVIGKRTVLTDFIDNSYVGHIVYENKN